MNGSDPFVADKPVERNASVGRRLSDVQLFYWSVRREIWENRSLYLAPLIVVAVILLGSFLGSFHMPGRRRSALSLDSVHRHTAIQLPYNIAAVMILLTAFLVGLFYCLDALHGERRDRSILFWKSLPVSDLITVISKAAVPLLVLPLIAFPMIVGTQVIMLLITSLALLPASLAGSTLANFDLVHHWLVMAYLLFVAVLWYAPIYSWALLVSGVSRRAPFLWAILPPLALAIFEKVTFHTSHFFALLNHRIFGVVEEAFAFRPHETLGMDSFVQLTPATFLTSPGLWLGLIVSAGFIFAAVQLRRYRGPI